MLSELFQSFGAESFALIRYFADDEVDEPGLALLFQPGSQVLLGFLGGIRGENEAVGLVVR